MSYASYTDAVLNAYLANSKFQETVIKKQEILDSITHAVKSVPTSVLFVGFGPWLMANRYKEVFVTEISNSVKSFLDQNNVKYTYIDANDLGNFSKRFDWVVAADEYFTFADSEEQQRAKISTVANLAKDTVVTTLKDYKNQDFKDREFSNPIAIRNEKNISLFLEYNNYDYRDKNTWTSWVYEIQDHNLKTHGPYSRCTMYFKQMAKFSLDAGAADFLVHKNLMYKSLIKKNYEHVISISFKRHYGNQSTSTTYNH